MKFTVLPVLDLPGVTRDLEQLQALATEYETKIKALEERKNFKPGAPEAQIAREVNKEFEPSPTKDALVLLQLNSKAAEVLTVCKFRVGGIQVGVVAFPNVAEEAVQTSMIPVPLGKKWEVKVAAGALSALNSSYAFLE